MAEPVAEPVTEPAPPVEALVEAPAPAPVAEAVAAVADVAPLGVESALSDEDLTAEVTVDEPVDYDSMKSRIESTRSRLKAKAFDAMMTGEAALLGRDLEGRSRSMGTSLGWIATSTRPSRPACAKRKNSALPRHSL